MEKGYFAAAWGDVTKSPGWFSKILRLGLLDIIPIFGAMVTNGYLYGWARDIAWNVHRPMPAKIFGNEDGKLYKRGFYILVLGVVLALVPGVINSCSDLFLNGSSSVYGGRSFALSMTFLSLLFSLLFLAASVAAAIFTWIGSVRISLYGTLSSGFQLGKVWAMLRYDFKGILRIFGMFLILGCIVTVLFAVSICLLVIMGVIAEGSVAYTFRTAQGGSSSIALVTVGLILLFIFFIVFLLVGAFATALCQALVARALGYWARQFEVSQWGGQEDPMPFELRQAAAPAPQPQQPAAPVQGNAAQQAERQMNFDPQTGQPIVRPQAKFDTQTGQPIAQAKFDTQTGQPIQQAPFQPQQPVAQPAPFQTQEGASVQPAQSGACAPEAAAVAAVAEPASAPAATEPATAPAPTEPAIATEPATASKPAPEPEPAAQAGSLPAEEPLAAEAQSDAPSEGEAPKQA